MAEVNTTGFEDAIKVRYEKRLLTRALPRLVHGRWATPATLTGFGSLEIRKYGSMAAVTSTLTEGTTPPESQAPTITKITMQPLYYGAYLAYTDKLDMVNFDPIVSEITGIMGEQAGYSADCLYRDAMCSGATADYSGGVSARGSLDAPDHDITYADLLIQMAEFEAANALPVDGDYYVAIIHPHSLATLLQDSTFVNLFQREAPSAIRNGFVGTLLNFRFYVSSNAKEYTNEGAGSTTDVYSMLLVGKDAVGCAGFGGMLPSLADSGGEGYSNNTGKAVKPVEIIGKALGSAGAADPLDQRGTIAWKMTLDVEILNSAFIRNLEHTNAFSDM